MGAYADRLLKVRGDKPSTQIREEKCARSKERHAQRKRSEYLYVQERLDYWRSLSFDEQLDELDKRPGNSTKQRVKIFKRMNKSE